MRDTTNYENMTVEELNDALAELEAKRIELRKQALSIVAIRNRRLAEQHAAEHGLTPEEYLSVKKQAVEKEIPLQDALKLGRKHKVAKQLQSVKADATAVTGTVVK